MTEIDSSQVVPDKSKGMPSRRLLRALFVVVWMGSTLWLGVLVGRHGVLDLASHTALMCALLVLSGSTAGWLFWPARGANAGCERDAGKQKSSEGPFSLAQSLVSIATLLIGLVLAGLSVLWSGGNVFATLVTCLAAATCGALIGFIFGLPLSDRGAAERSDAQDGSDSGKRLSLPVARRSAVAPNTGLEEVSRWLAGVIVGAGLVNVNGFLAWLGKLGKGLDAVAGLGPHAGDGSTFGAACLVYFAIVGFLSVFSYTRTTFSQMIARSDRSLVLQVEQQERELKDTALEVRKHSDELETTRATLNTMTQDALADAKSQAHKAQGADPAAVQRVSALLESRLLMALYEAAPKGYETILREAESNQNQLSPRAWLWVACADGQKLSDLRRRGALTPKDEAGIRAEALTALSHAAGDESVRQHAAKLLMQELGPHENDLLPFRDDQEFRKILQV